MPASTLTHTRAHASSRTCDILSGRWVDSSHVLLRRNLPPTLHYWCSCEPWALMICSLCSLRGLTHKLGHKHRNAHSDTHIKVSVCGEGRSTSPSAHYRIMWFPSPISHIHTHILKFSDYRMSVTTLMSTQIKPAVKIMVTCARPMKLEWCFKAFQ